jgi:hypothetical protein
MSGLTPSFIAVMRIFADVSIGRAVYCCRQLARVIRAVEMVKAKIKPQQTGVETKSLVWRPVRVVVTVALVGAFVKYDPAANFRRMDSY